MRRRWMLLLAPVVLAGCLNSQGVQALFMPKWTLHTPVAWDCTQRTPHPHGEVRMDGTPVMCQRCANRSDAVQEATIVDTPYLVLPGDGLYRCDNLQVLADPRVTHAR